MALATDTKAALDTALGDGGAAKIVALINSATALDGPTRALLAQRLHGIGEATSFETIASTTGTLTIAQKQMLTLILNGAGKVADLQTAITGGSA